MKEVKVYSAIFNQILYVLCLYKTQISGVRLQDHWSSVFSTLHFKLQLFYNCSLRKSVLQFFSKPFAVDNEINV